MKDLYFTVLTRFSRAQLEEQLNGLRRLETESAAHLEKVRAEERIERRLAKSAQHRRSGSQQDETRTSEGDGGGDDDGVLAKETAPTGESESRSVAGEAHLSKQRRRTLRKQIERITALLSQSPTEEAVVGFNETDIDLTAVSNPKTRGGWGFWKN